MSISPPARADRRALFSAAALGACLGLALGGAYLAGGLARAVTPAAPAVSASTFALAPAPSSIPVPPTFHRADPLQPARGPAVAPFRLRGALSPARDLECLSQAVYYEARGESSTGQAAVAQVVLNRVRHPRFPKSVCGVVFQQAGEGCQFSFACDGSMRRGVDVSAWRQAQGVAARALRGFVMPQVAAATDFRVAHIPAFGLERVAQIGSHVFYRFGGRLGEARALIARPQPSAPAPTPVFAALATPTVGQVAAAGIKAAAEQAASAVVPTRPAAEPAAPRAAPAAEPAAVIRTGASLPKADAPPTPAA